MGTQIVCDPNLLLCSPPGMTNANSCPNGTTGGGMTSGGTTGNGINGCLPTLLVDGGYCAPTDGGCACGANFDCCSGCCDLSAWPGVCVDGSGITPGFHRGPQPSGNSGGLGGCGIPTCSPFGGTCSTTPPATLCCGENAPPPATAVSCQNSVCCQPYDGGCITAGDCCSGNCSDTFTCR
jgi:hypothetical protein